MIQVLVGVDHEGQMIRRSQDQSQDQGKKLMRWSVTTVMRWGIISINARS